MVPEAPLEKLEGMKINNLFSNYNNLKLELLPFVTNYL